MLLKDAFKILLNLDKATKLAIVVSALGYFVDVFDLLLFNVVRRPSLISLGLSDQEVFEHGTSLLNIQMIGMIAGGILWGILGDKVGRLQVLFGSILLYSVANIANGFVSSVEQYELCRLIAGIGLAGEVGGGLTLVAEILPKEIRGLGTTIFATVGVLGGVAAGFVGEAFDWRTAYIIGGVAGLVLLFLRISVRESSIFERLKNSSKISRGSLLVLLGTKERVIRYVSCILLVSPLWITAACLAAFAPELGKALGIVEPVSAGKCVIMYTLGMAAGDLSSGLISQKLRSRKKVLYLFLTIFATSTALILFIPGTTAQWYYRMMVPVGFGIGFWTVLLTTAAEQFGTNIRATAATTIPNLGRATAIPITLAVKYLQPIYGIATSITIVSTGVVMICFCAISCLRETFAIDLDFIEK